MNGCFSLVLHAHLPYVLAHGRWPHGTDWLSEATAETYIPLLNAVHNLVADGIKPHVAIDITPVLAEQLAAPDFAAEFDRYLLNRAEAAEQDMAEFEAAGEPTLLPLARHWRGFYTATRHDFTEHYHQDLNRAFRELQEAGAIELFTCAATHGYLPLLKNEESIQAQLRIGVETHERRFGRKPRGIWLPECAYRPSYRWRQPGSGAEPWLRPGIDEFLSDLGLEWFIVDSHLLKGGKPVSNYLARFAGLRRLWQQFESERGLQGPAEGQVPFRPCLVASNPAKRPVAVFARDPDSARQVWSGETGYPGDESYLEFHKRRYPSGLRYWRVTDPKADLGAKQTYDPERTAERTREHARHFTELVVGLLAEAPANSGTPELLNSGSLELLNSGTLELSAPPVLLAPFDAELFGHWWFEGPHWIESLYRQLAAQTTVTPVTPSEYLVAHPPTQVVELPEGSWGEGGFHYIWLNPDTAWTWRDLYQAEDDFLRALRVSRRTEEEDRILRQAARELLLMQSSDWQFLISARNTRDYAEERFRGHFGRLRQMLALAHKLAQGRGLSVKEHLYLKSCEEVDALFADLDLKAYTLPRP